MNSCLEKHEVVKEFETRDPGWTIEDAIRAVVLGGIIGPT